MKLLPDILGSEDFRLWRANPDLWSPMVRKIACVADVEIDALTPFTSGTNLVVDLNGSAVLKLFPPIYVTQFAVERAALRQLDGHLSIPIPSICAEGHESGWSWLILTKLSGTVGSEVWPTLSEDERWHIIGQIGRTIAEVQGVPPGSLAAAEPTWSDFIASQSARCIERHRSYGLPPHLLKDLAALLVDAPFVLPRDVKPKILTGEDSREFVALKDTGWMAARSCCRFR